MVPIDPIRWLYRWEREFLEEFVPFGGAKEPQEIAVIQDNCLPFFKVVFDSPSQNAVDDPYTSQTYLPILRKIGQETPL
jgi:hypothetical protein